jgi:hypothetical protein
MAFKVFQSLWGMEQLPFGGAPEWSLREKLDRVTAADFDGLEIAWTPTLPAAREALELMPESELEWSILCFPTSVDDFKAVADKFAGSRLSHVNVQPNVRPYTVLEAIPYVLGWLEVARDAELTVYFETHRDRMTTDLRYTLQLIDAIPDMKLVADLSHFVVGEEFAWPIGDADEAMIQRILARSHGFHGRVASREQVQIPLGFPQSRQWLELFLRWWEDGFAAWHGQAGPEDELVFVTELGPPTYAITGADGGELSDRWEEALLLKDLVRELWSRVEAAAPKAEDVLQR